jgi:hypothetical protein
MLSLIGALIFLAGDIMVTLGIVAIAELQAGWPWGKILSTQHRHTGWGLILLGVVLAASGAVLYSV